jgi:hypothetical protein
MELDSTRSKHDAEIAVSDMLNHAYSWLSRAVASTDTDPMHVKEVRAYAYTISEATKQRDLSRSIKMDAEEMARRADYALGKAIRDGQDNGMITTVKDNHRHSVDCSVTEKSNKKVSASDLATNAQLYGDGRNGKNNGILALADNASPAEFEEALTEAKAEGNLSRANLVRKVSPERHDSEPDVIDVDSETVDVETGEVVEETPKRLNRSMKICATTVGDLETTMTLLSYIDYESITTTQARDWAARLEEPMKALRKFNNQIQKKAA